ncbi:cation transporter [Paenibacillus montanisoli]|uniref:Copper chaperone n=1 Tax=Paenibacillus montanisoli TaxID=2081970 RepID=A0A328UBL1_9BACL|nr:cation transporter [Paenibacillus montanisoli]RAP78285.1 copper chaperone [Paenibacillus montanisoli]
MTTVIQVKGMSCQHCVNSIEGALKKSGVAAKVDLRGSRVTVHFEETAITLDRIKSLIEDQGFDVV